MPSPEKERVQRKIDAIKRSRHETVQIPRSIIGIPIETQTSIFVLFSIDNKGV